VVGPEFVDAKSARDDNRPGFQAMFDVVRSGNAPFDLVLVHSYSRFYRENVGLELYYRTLRKRKIELISITQDVGEGSTADLIRQIIALLDEHTSKETAKHVERGLKENARQGFFNGSSVPFGLQSVVVEVRGRKVKKRLDIEPVEADVVRKIFELYLQGDGSSGRMGIASIVEWLNVNGYRTRKGKLWGNAQLHRLLTNPIYKGDYVYNRRAEEEQRIATAVPAIISAPLFDAVQRDLPSRDPRITPPRVVNGPILLSGVAHCSGCGARLIAVSGIGNGGRYQYYKCATKHRSGKSACSVERNIPLPELDELVTERVVEQVLAPDRLGALLAGLLKRQTAKDHERAAHLSAMKKDSPKPRPASATSSPR
jgi:DNA invertase Pin-like site-specific DNA recombinase